TRIRSRVRARPGERVHRLLRTGIRQRPDDSGLLLPVTQVDKASCREIPFRSMASTPQEPALALPASTSAEAARYALLRRLAPSMRHHLVVNLQPIGMIYEVMDRRLRAPEPALGEDRKSVV